jgi:spore coat protein A
MLNRRRFLTLGGVAGGALLFPVTRSAPAGAQQSQPHVHGMMPGAGPVRVTAPAVPPFTVDMPVPPVLRPVWSGADLDVYRLDITRADVEILPGVRTPALTYDGRFVGPTIRARAGRRARVMYRNRLDQPANVHLHGGHVAPGDDGHPMDIIEPGGTRSYDYPNRQQGATLWYHDHAHHLEAEHVYRGLHGFYVLDDDAERSLRLPGGAFDVPIMLRDALFDANGALVFGGDPAERTTFLANGRPVPYFAVAARKYRFRLLNSATDRVFRLNLGGAEMVQIASDGGLLPAPVPYTELTFSSGERLDIVVDFSRYPLGSQLVLADATGGPVLRFDVVRTARDDSVLPDRLRPAPSSPPATVTREVSLSFDLSTGIPVGLVNGKPYDPERTDFTVKHGTTEIWQVTNADPFDHNFHLHLVPFRVLDRDGAAPWPQDAGRKDTIFIPAGASARIQATFEGFLGKYVYHCHFIEHATLGMMAQLDIVA